MKRISLMIRRDQYENLSSEGINVSGLIRDMIDDYISDHCITLSVSEETASLYKKIVANSGTSDKEIEPHFREALKKVLAAKIKEMEALQKTLL